MDLRAVNYYWKNDEYPEMNFNSQAQIGVIAQELGEVIPELVRSGANGYKSVDYAKLSVVLMEAVKEQQEIIEELDKRVSNLEVLERQVEELKVLISQGTEK